MVCQSFLARLYVVIKASINGGAMKIEIQPCSKVDLVDSLKNIESNLLTQAVDQNVNFSNSLVTPLEQLAVASTFTQVTISK